jgi:hypothetical protein
MKVKQAINMLKDYDENEEIFLMYWSKDVFEDSMEITNKEWKKIILLLDEYSFDNFSYDLVDAIETELEEMRKINND